MGIVQFPGAKEPERLIWKCNPCGCQSFELYADGSTECCNCGKVSKGPEDGEWFRLKPPAPAEPKEAPTDGLRVVRISNSGAALKHVLDDCDDEKTAFVIVVQKDGHTSTWKGREFDDAGAVYWLDDMLEGGRKLLLPVGTDPSDLDGLRQRITNSGELHSVVVIRQDGDTAVWISAVCGPPEGAAQEAWLDRKLATARELYLDKNYTPPDALQPDLFKEPK